MTDIPHRIEHMALSDLLARFHPRNPKDHDLLAIEASFERFGFADPVLLDERTGIIAAGHGRLEALSVRASRQGESDAPGAPRWVIANDDGGDWRVPTVRGWSSADDDELLAYVITDNHLVPLGGWRTDILAPLLAELGQTTGGLPPGWAPADVDALLAEVGPPPDFQPGEDGDQPRLDRKFLLVCRNCGSPVDPADADRIESQ